MDLLPYYWRKALQIDFTERELIEILSQSMVLSSFVTFVAMTVCSIRASYGRYSSESSLRDVWQLYYAFQRTSIPREGRLFLNKTTLKLMEDRFSCLRQKNLQKRQSRDPIARPLQASEIYAL